MVYKSLVNLVFTNYFIGGYILFYKNLRPLLHNETIDPYFFKITQVNSENLKEKDFFIPIAGCVRFVKRFYVHRSESVNPKTGTVFLKPSDELENCCYLYEGATASYRKTSDTPDNGGIDEVYTAYYLMIDGVKDLSTLLTERNRFLQSDLGLQSSSLGVSDGISEFGDYRKLNLFPSPEVIIRAYQNCDENIAEKYGTELFLSETYKGYSDPSLDDVSFDTLKISNGCHFLNVKVDSSCPVWVTTKLETTNSVDNWFLVFSSWSTDDAFFHGNFFEYSKNPKSSGVQYFNYLKLNFGSSFPDMIKSFAYEGSEKSVLGLIFNQYPTNSFIPDSFKPFHHRWMLMQRPTSAGSDDSEILKNLETIMANIDLVKKGTSEGDSLLREVLSKVATLGTIAEDLNVNEIKSEFNELVLSVSEMLSLKESVEKDLNLTNDLSSQVKVVLDSLSDLNSKVISSYKDYLIEAKEISVEETAFFLKLQIAVEQMSNLEQLVSSLTEVQNCVTSLNQINSHLSLNAKIYQEFDKSNKFVSVSNGVNSCASLLNSISSLVNIKGGKSW